MRVALAHDYLNQYGGGERVLETLTSLFPDAPIYTLLYDTKKTFGKFEGRVRKTSFLDFTLARSAHRLFIPFMPLAAEHLKIDRGYDLLISETAGFAKGFTLPPGLRHLSYVHTPLRYAWENSYLDGKAYVGGKKKLFILPALQYLRRWDFAAAQKPDRLLVNSRFIQEKVGRYYKRVAEVVYPPVDLTLFRPMDPDKRSYFLAIGRLLHYKKFDLIIRTFNALNLPIKIVGEGPEETALRRLATNPLIEFLPFEESSGKLRALYAGARALIFPQVEDFGLVAAEATACGTPVIAYAAGGAREIVNNANGLLFKEQTPAALTAAVLEFLEREPIFRTTQVAQTAERFSKERFIAAIVKHAAETAAGNSTGATTRFA